MGRRCRAGVNPPVTQAAPGRYGGGLTDYDHITDLRERRAAYADLLRAINTGKLLSDDPKGDAARMQDLKRKIAELDLLIDIEERRRAQGS